ncbi:MAG: hypothetical protein ACI4RT_03130, partial [Candidatus Spyradenecus sp.]
MHTCHFDGLTAIWSYEPTRNLLTQVENALPDGSTLSAYTYTNALLGRRVSYREMNGATQVAHTVFLYN